MDEVRRNAAVFLYQTDPRRSGATAHEGLLHAPRPNQWCREKAGGRAVSAKAAAVHPAAAVVCRTWCSHSRAPHDRLSGDKGLYLVCRAGDRRPGDADKSKAKLAEVFKLLGSSAYRKTIEAVKRQTCVIYTKDEKVVDPVLRSALFEDLEELGQAYELESRKLQITINRPFQIGINIIEMVRLVKARYQGYSIINYNSILRDFYLL